MTEQYDGSQQAKEIRVLIADDHPLMRRGLATLILTEPGMDLVGQAEDGLKAVSLARMKNPDVILMDLTMPRMDGIEAIGKIKQENPDVRILVLTSFSDDDHVFAAISAGALGYVLKDIRPEELLQAIRDVHQGQSSLSPQIARKLIRQINQPSDQPDTTDPLTERETDVLVLVARGLSNRQIAEELVIGERTVAVHMQSILAKLHLANRTQAALFALRKGLADLEAD